VLFRSVGAQGEERIADHTGQLPDPAIGGAFVVRFTEDLTQGHGYSSSSRSATVFIVPGVDDSE
jgi:hypothetical protein